MSGHETRYRAIRMFASRPDSLPMRHRLPILLPILGALLPAQALPTKDEVLALLAQHARAVMPDPRAVACFTCTGTVESGATRSAIRLFVRREPFACRAEIEPLAPAGSTGVTITDGRLAWDGAGRPLGAEAAQVCFEDAFVDGLLYLDGQHVSGLPDSWEPVVQPDYEGLPADVPRGLRTLLFAEGSPAGSTLQLHLDLDRGALREVVSIVPGFVRWIRFGGERRFGGLMVPMVRASGRVGVAGVEVRRWSEVKLEATLPAELFAGCPLPVTPSLQKAGRFLVVPHTLASSVHFELPVVTLNRSQPVRALFDTGCTDLCIAPELARALRLPARSGRDVQGFGAKAETSSGWIEVLEFADRVLLQRVEPVADLGFENSLPLDRQLGMLVGFTAFADSPVLDFVTGELTCRGAPVVPLAKLGDGGRVFTVPLRRQDSLQWYVTIEVNGTRLEAMLDTGTPLPLRLSRAALQRCGLPVDSATWIASGGGQSAASGIGNARWHDVVAPLPSWKLGSVTFEKSLVFLGGLDDGAAQHWDAIVGAGALAAFARVGFDLQRGCLELDPGEGLLGGVAALPGEYLGFQLGSPPAAMPARVLPLPTITEVFAGSPAARAGLAPRDRIWSIGGQPCAGLPAGEVNRQFWLRRGEQVEFEVLARDGTRRTVRLP